MPAALGAAVQVADRLVYSKVKERLGGRLRLAISGGAPLVTRDRGVLPRARHPADRGLRPDRVHDGRDDEHATRPTASAPSAGRCPAPRCGWPRTASCSSAARRSSRATQGSRRRPPRCSSADGWLLTGDIAEIDDDGFVKITDRKKDIIVTAGGKNVAPQNLENDLKTSKYISQAMVVGDRQPYIAALITLDPEELPEWAAEHGLPAEMERLARDEQVRS